MLANTSCPYGGQFYHCSNLTNNFVGCCNTSACGNDNGCQGSDLRSMSWTADDDSGDDFFQRRNDLAQRCALGSSWYICPDDHPQLGSPPPFMGCCKSHPCSNGCPGKDLAQAFLVNETTIAEGFLSAIGFSPPSTTSSWPSSLSRPSPSSSSSSSSSPTNIGFGDGIPVDSSAPTADIAGHSALLTGTPPSKSTNTLASITTNTLPLVSTNTTNSKSNSTAIAGGVTGGIVGLALLVGLLAICCRRRNARQQHTVEGRSSALGSGQLRSLQADSAELEEMKQGPTPTSSPLHPPSPPSSPLISPLPPPPAYAPYIPHGNELNRSFDHFHSSSGSPYVSYDLPSPDSPPAPPPLKRRLSQHSASNYSDEPSVSPMSSHYQHRPFDN